MQSHYHALIAADDPTRERLRELALFLRSRRAQMQPEALGLPRGDRRRVPGLRREEVALTAGVSTTWYTWLEQGRDINAGPEALDAVCRALNCDDDERRYVRRLAGCPILERYERPVEADPALVALLDDLLPNPACVTSESYDILAWNTAWTVVLSDPATQPPDRRNLIWMAFLTPEIRRRTVNWASASKAGLAFARAEAAKHPENPRFREVISMLSEADEEFQEAWALQEVRHPPHLTHVLSHERIGEVEFRIVHLTSSREQPSHVIVFQACGSESQERLARWLALPDTTSRP